MITPQDFDSLSKEELVRRLAIAERALDSIWLWAEFGTSVSEKAADGLQAILAPVDESKKEN